MFGGTVAGLHELQAGKKSGKGRGRIIGAQETGVSRARAPHGGRRKKDAAVIYCCATNHFEIGQRPESLGAKPGHSVWSHLGTLRPGAHSGLGWPTGVTQPRVSLQRTSPSRLLPAPMVPSCKSQTWQRFLSLCWPRIC